MSVWTRVGEYALRFAAYAYAERYPVQRPGPIPTPKPPEDPPMPAPPVVPVEPLAPSGPAPLPDLVAKWRGTLDAMAIATLGHRMADDEVYHNAHLLEKGAVAGVQRNLDAKK